LTPARRHAWTPTDKGSSKAPSSVLTWSGNLQIEVHATPIIIQIMIIYYGNNRKVIIMFNDLVKVKNDNKKRKRHDKKRTNDN
jgi:hypothetical protein